MNYTEITSLLEQGESLSIVSWEEMTGEEITLAAREGRVYKTSHVVIIHSKECNCDNGPMVKLIRAGDDDISFDLKAGPIPDVKIIDGGLERKILTLSEIGERYVQLNSLYEATLEAEKKKQWEKARAREGDEPEETLLEFRERMRVDLITGLKRSSNADIKKYFNREDDDPSYCMLNVKDMKALLSRIPND